MKRMLFRSLAALLAVAGLGLLLYPNIRRAVASRQSAAVIRTVEAYRQEESAGKEEAAPQQDPLYRDMQAYNRQIYQDRQSGLQDAWSYEQPPFSLEEYGVVQQAVGYLTIAAMDLELPLYLGAGKDNLAQGAAVLGNTSMPVGGENTNCVIAGHRGWQGIPMFRDIEKLQPGDRVQLDTLWETLWYEVEEIRIIAPDEIDAVRIQEGRDLLTLITCHPYPHNYQRYLVYCQRVEPEQQAAAPQKRETAPDLHESGQDSSRQVIRLEQQANRVALLLVLPALTLAVLWLLMRKRKGGKSA